MDLIKRQELHYMQVRTTKIWEMGLICLNEEEEFLSAPKDTFCYLLGSLRRKLFY